jgi:molybdopterin-guanine dinucleotide biosynthesis protein B
MSRQESWNDPAMRVLGLAGWNGAGKTTLLRRLLPALIAQGLRVSTVKHAHHSFDIDTPGKDSWEHRQAGAAEVMVASARRWALMHELRDQAEPRLPELLAQMTRVDLVIVEGFKRESHPKIEVFRQGNGKPLLHPNDSSIVAIVADAVLPGLRIPFHHLDDVTSIAAAVWRYAVPLDGIVWRVPVSEGVS